MEKEISSQEIAIVEPKVERIEKFISLDAGHYWRVIKDINGKEKDFPVGKVFLLKNVRCVDNVPHTVEVLCHPNSLDRRSTFSVTLFLVDKFLAHFEYEPDGKLVRKKEIEALNLHIQKLQGNLQDIQNNPAQMDILVLEHLQKENPDLRLINPQQLALPALNSLSSDSVAILQQSANQLAEQANAKASILTKQAEEISDAIGKLSPYFEEMAQAALAKSSEEIKYVEKLRTGIQSLDLYIGKGVIVQRIAEGEPAPYDEPLTVLQRKLMMDEEMCLFADVNEQIDISDYTLFEKLLREKEALVDQIFTTKRSICVMATSRRYINYSEDARHNALLNDDNRVVFLLVRNGGNIYRVYSSVESHLGTNRLFPSKDDQDKIFRGMSGDAITYDDVRFTDSLNRHETFSLHYKRFLLLMAGLDHREQLFGEFYPRSINFMSLAFQEQYMRFVHDDDGTSMLSDGYKEKSSAFIARNNQYVTAGRGGSRVLCDFDRLVTKESAPGAYSKGSHEQEKYQIFSPVERFAVLPVRESNGRFYVDMVMRRTGGRGWWDDKKKRQKITVKVFLMDENARFYNSNGYPAFLHFDTARLEEVQRHLNDRKERAYHMEYIRFFKRVETMLIEREQAYSAIRDKVFVMMPQANENETLLFNLFIAYQAANDFIIPTATAYNEIAAQLMAQMECHTSDIYFEKIQAFAAKKDVGTLRHVSSLGDGRIFVYAEPLESEVDARLGGFPWLHRLALVDSKRGFRVVGKDWQNEPVKTIREVFFHREDLKDVELTVADIFNETPYQFKNPEHKKNTYDTLTRFFYPFALDVKDRTLEHYFEARDEASTSIVASVQAAYPAALMKEGNRLYMLFLVIHDPASFYYFHSKSEIERQQIIKNYTRIYKNSSKMRQNLLDNYSQWGTAFSLMKAPIASVQDKYYANPIDRLPLFITEAKASWKTVSSYSVLKGESSIDAELTNYVQKQHFSEKPVEFFWATYEDEQLSPYRNEFNRSFDDVFLRKRPEYQRVTLYLCQKQIKPYISPFDTTSKEEANAKQKDVPPQFYTLDFLCRDKAYFKTLTDSILNKIRESKGRRSGFCHELDERCGHCRYRTDRSDNVSSENRPFGCSRQIKINAGEGTIEELFSLEEIKKYASGESTCRYHEMIEVIRQRPS